MNSEPVRRDLNRPIRIRTREPRQVMDCMAPGQLRPFATFKQPLERIGTCRVEQAVPDKLMIGFDRDQRFVYQVSQRLNTSPDREVRPADDLSHRLQCDSALEYCHSTQQYTIALPDRAVAPVKHRIHRLMTSYGGSPTSRE